MGEFVVAVVEVEILPCKVDDKVDDKRRALASMIAASTAATITLQI